MKKYFIAIIFSAIIGGSLGALMNVFGGVDPYVSGAIIGGICAWVSQYTINYYNNK